MSEIIIPDEAKFESIKNDYYDIAIGKIEKSVILTNQTFGGSSNPIIQFNIDGSPQTRLDLSSLYIIGDLNMQLTVGTNAYNAPTANNKNIPYVPASSELFSSITLSTRSGQIIEQLNNVDIINQVVKLCISQDYADSVLSFGLNELNYNKRRQPTWIAGTLAAPGGNVNYAAGQNICSSAAAPLRIKVDALYALGFFKTEKFFPTFLSNGITLSLTMKSDNAIGFCYNADDTNVLFTLSNLKLYYQDILCKNEYIQSWNDTYGGSGGFEMLYNTYTTMTLTPSGDIGNAIVEMPFQMNLQKCKGILAVVRLNANLGLKAENDMAFCSAGFEGTNGLGYQFVLNGVQYPSIPVTSYARSMEQFLSVCRLENNTFPHCSLIDFERWASDDPSTIAGNDRSTTTYTSASKQLGAFVMAIDLERYNSNSRSGLTLAGTHSMLLSWAGTTVAATLVAPRITLIFLHDKVAKFTNQQVITYQ